jgi:hypothetical protein
MIALLSAHAGGRPVAIIAGAIAIATRTNGSLHAFAGTWFFGSMLVLGATRQSSPGFKTPPGLGTWNPGLLLRSDIVGERTSPRRNDHN